jgi:hypothetical protein
MLALLLVLGGCEGASEERLAAQDQPLDGSRPLRPSRGAEADKLRADDPCSRQEKGGWHSSMGHCEEMLPPQPMTGVFVMGFEENSFFPGATTIPDRNDSRRYRLELEVDPARVRELAGRKLNGPTYQAYRLKFTGRRTRFPVFILCSGDRGYVFIADQVDEAQYLGAMADPDLSAPPPDKTFKRSGQGGKIRKMEDEALASCSGR